MMLCSVIIYLFALARETILAEREHLLKQKSYECWLIDSKD